MSVAKSSSRPGSLGEGADLVGAKNFVFTFTVFFESEANFNT